MKRKNVLSIIWPNIFAPILKGIEPLALISKSHHVKKVLETASPVPVLEITKVIWILAFENR